MSQSSKIVKQAARFDVAGVRDEQHKVKLVSPASFSTLATAGVVNLVNPNGSAFKVPVGYIVRSAIIRASTAITSGGSATLSLGLNATSATTDATILTTAAFANVNLGLYCGQVLATATPVIASASDRYVVATCGTADLTAGAIEVILDLYKVKF